jgi:2-dehydro-3-deoxyphosphogluconate aldolase / (4S)-4-hydroxy-2-oxoglutarate aldolase
MEKSHSGQSGSIFEQLKACRIIPVVKLPAVEHAEPLAEALLAAGVTSIEITLRSEAGLGAIAALSRAAKLLVGAGTVRSVEQARAAISAGANFVVSPGTREDVVRYCNSAGVPVCPGVCTPNEVEQALDCGAGVLKFFPASVFGGVATLQALAAVYPEVPFFPTGGIKPENLVDYLRQPNVLCCGGTWLAPPELLAAGRFDEVEARTRQALTLAAQARS